MIFAFASHADDMYFHNTVEGNPIGSNHSFTDTNAWVAEDGTTLYNRAPTASDNIFFDLSTNEDKTEYIYLPGEGRDCVFRGNPVVNDFTIQNNFSTSLALDNNATLTVNGNLYKYRGTNANAGASNMRFTYSGNGAEQAPTIVVKGDVVVGELAEDGSATISAGGVQFGGDGNSTTSWNASLKSVRIEGNLIARYNSSVSFNTGYDYDGTSYATVDEYAQYLLNTGAAPTVEVLGAAMPKGGDAGGGFQNPTLYLSSRTHADVVGSVSIVSINGINGVWGTLSNYVSSTTASDSLSILKLTNDSSSNYSSNSWIFDLYNNSTPVEGQRVRTMIVMAGAGSQKFTGEKFCISGGVSVYSGTLQVNMSNSVEALTYSRGDLKMYGGKFGSLLASEKNPGQANMMFSDLVYYDGTILTYVKDGSADKLTLSGTLKKDIDFLDGAKMNFEISGDLESIIDTFVQLLAWDNENKIADFTSDEFSANSFMVGDKTYNPLFEIRDDGLWVSYIQAVPEPAMFAALFGFVALLFASRRKK